MTIGSLDDLFLNSLGDVLYAERTVLKTLQKLERTATDAKLKQAFASHCEATDKQIARLEEVFDILGKPARPTRCGAADGLVEQTERIIGEIDDADTMDAALISLAQAIEHYELAQYGTLVAWAAQLGQPKAAALLKTTLDEEYSADRALSTIAEKRLNAAAAA